jgi:hypothetical protein
MRIAERLTAMVKMVARARDCAVRTAERECGASLVEYALGVALVITVSLGAIQYFESSSADGIDRRSATVGTPAELNGNINTGPTGTPIGDGSDPGGDDPPTVGSSVGGIDVIDRADDPPGNFWLATVEVTIVDALGDPVPGAIITATWTPTSGETQTTCVTTELGACRFTQQKMNKNTVGSVTFTVSNVTGEGITYQPDQNVTSSVSVPKP